MSQRSNTEPAALERRTIDIIPLAERHGKPRDLFTIWFGSNMMLLTFVTGAWPRGLRADVLAGAWSPS